MNYLSFEKATGIFYICLKCSSKIKSEDLAYIGILECLECGYEIIRKSRPETVKVIKAN